MIIKNNTHYYTEFTKLYNIVPDNNSFQFESSKRLGFYQRLYFEYLYTQKVNGITFYYTLTYNDKSIPKWKDLHGVEYNVFSYNDIRKVTNGVISKRLQRDYGARLRYFCACETGEGKGKRGLGNNPHLHFIFFVQPIHVDDEPQYNGYKKIDPSTFHNMVLDMWQGSHSFIRFQFARFGIAKEGKFGNVVTSPAAFKYVGKYVLKDSSEVSLLSKVREYYINELNTYGPDSRFLLTYYRYIKQSYPSYTKYDFWKDYDLGRYTRMRRNNPQFRYYSYYKFMLDYLSDAVKLNFIQMMNWYDEVYKGFYVDYFVSQWKNKYSGKVRCSKSLGEFGLHFIQHIDSNPTLSIPSAFGYDIQVPCLYYIRKLYYDVRICPVTGNPLYVLSDLGKRLKVNQLPKKIDSFIQHTNNNLFTFDYKSNGIKIHSENNSDIPQFYSQSFIDSVLTDSHLPEIVNFYSVYHHVYQYRRYQVGSFYLTEHYDFNDVLSDYKCFLNVDLAVIDYEHVSVGLAFSDCSYRSFDNHPLFSPYLKYFQFFDDLNSVADSINSDAKRKKFTESSEHQKRVNQFLFNSQLDHYDVSCFASSPLINGPLPWTM